MVSGDAGPINVGLGLHVLDDHEEEHSVGTGGSLAVGGCGGILAALGGSVGVGHGDYEVLVGHSESRIRLICLNTNRG